MYARVHFFPPLDSASCRLFLQTMSASRLFAEVSDADLVKFSEENENENTAKKADRNMILESSGNTRQQ